MVSIFDELKQCANFVKRESLEKGISFLMVQKMPFYLMPLEFLLSILSHKLGSMRILIVRGTLCASRSHQKCET